MRCDDGLHLRCASSSSYGSTGASGDSTKTVSKAMREVSCPRLTWTSITSIVLHDVALLVIVVCM